VRDRWRFEFRYSEIDPHEDRRTNPAAKTRVQMLDNRSNYGHIQQRSGLKSLSVNPLQIQVGFLTPNFIKNGIP
jgi:hypothetical protein